MNLCDNDHEQIVFEGSPCPLCEANDNVAELGSEVDDLQSQIDQMRDEYAELEDQL